MVGVRGGKQRKASLADSHAQRIIQHLQNRQRTNVDPLVVISQLQSGEHPLDQHTFTGTCIADDPDQLIHRAQILLCNLHSQFRHSLVSSWCKIDAVQMTDIRHTTPPFLHCADIPIGIPLQNPYRLCLFCRTVKNG